MIFYPLLSRYLDDIWIYLWLIQWDLQDFFLHCDYDVWISCISIEMVAVWKNVFNSSETSWSLYKMSVPLSRVIFVEHRPLPENKSFTSSLKFILDFLWFFYNCFSPLISYIKGMNCSLILFFSMVHDFLKQKRK